jgi:glycosyltransferase involved in cell wall biosynthesis
MGRVLLCLAHSIEEHDQLRLLHGLGYDVASLGGYIDPRVPHDDKRPALDIPQVDVVRESVDALGVDDNIGAAQAHIPEPILEWLGADGIIIYHHYLERLFAQWPHLGDWRSGGGRVVWRTVGQSVEPNERRAKPFVHDGLEVVRYSPKERNIPSYSGESALIRFYKDPEEWTGWTGTAEGVINFTQDMLARESFCNYGFWKTATAALPAKVLGPGSEQIGGPGKVSEPEMQSWLRQARCYLYTGTQPASYTLGLLEAMMTGCPVVSIGPKWMTHFPYGPDMFEGHELAGLWDESPTNARSMLRALLEDHDLAREVSERQQSRTRAEFGMEPVGRAWAAFLG